jgi:hypothetical protein
VEGQVETVQDKGRGRQASSHPIKDRDTDGHPEWIGRTRSRIASEEGKFLERRTYPRRRRDERPRSQ